MHNVKKLIPGIATCACIAVPCWFLGQSFPLVGGPVFAILTGMAVSALWRKDARESVQAGISFTAKKILQYAVVLLGFGLNLLQIAQVGLMSLPVILSTIATSLTVAYLMHRLLRTNANSATLIGVGSSICGGSAIAATAPVINASEEEIAQAVSVIFLFNVIAALAFPTLGTLLGLSNEGFALFAGTAVNDTSSVTAAAAAWDDMHPGANTLEQATIVKLTRTLAIIPITLVLAIIASTREHRQEKASRLENFSFKRAFPLFILWFVVASVITTGFAATGIDPAIFAPLKTLSKFFICMAMAAIGLNTNVAKLVRSGAKPIATGFCCWIAIAIVSLGMQAVLGMW